MKKILLYLFLLLWTSIQAESQSYTANLQKYWWYRYMLVNDFMKIGGNCGESIPASGRNLSNWPVPNPFLEWGDATTRLGNYLTILATEYKLLKQNNLSVERTKYEMYYALKAFDRLDLTAEERCRNFTATQGCQNINPHTGTGYFANDFNGFFIRDDVPGSFTYNNNAAHFNRLGVCHQIEGAWGDVISRTDQGFAQEHSGSTWSGTYPNTPRYPVEESQDQLIDLYKGFALISYLVSGSEQYNGESLKGLATDAIFRMTSYASYPGQGVWNIVNPLTGFCAYGVHPGAYTSGTSNLCATGANAMDIAPGAVRGLMQINAAWDPVKLGAITYLLLPSTLQFEFLYQYEKYWQGATCQDDNNVFWCTMAAIANDWTTPNPFLGGVPTPWTRKPLNNLSSSCNLRYPHLPLIYRILHGGPLFNPAAFPHNLTPYEQRLDAAPPCGIYNYTATIQPNPNHDILAANWEWSSPDRIVEAKKRGWQQPNGQGSDQNPNADFPGLGYMTIFNLYAMNKSTYPTFYNNPYYQEYLSQVYPFI